MKNIAFRVSDEDHAAIQAAADHAFMSIAAFLRKLALEYSRDNVSTHGQHTDSVVPSVRAKPDAAVENDDLLRALESGARPKDIAAASGLTVQELQIRSAKARAARKDGSLERETVVRKFQLDNPCPDLDTHKLSVTHEIDGTYSCRWVLKQTAAFDHFPGTDDPEVNSKLAAQRLREMGFNL
jgi:hypothetical protein